MEIPGLGVLTLDESLGWFLGPVVTAGALGGAEGQLIVVADDVPGRDPVAVHRAVATFLSGPDARPAAADAVYAYYLDMVRIARDSGWGDEVPVIAGPDEVWEHVTIGGELLVDRDTDGTVYVSVECACSWEPEHGLQVVLRGGGTITKVGPYDGHLTHAAAFDRDDLVDVVYQPLA